jgi:hypothetical protein
VGALLPPAASTLSSEVLELEVARSAAGPTRAHLLRRPRPPAAHREPRRHRAARGVRCAQRIEHARIVQTQSVGAVHLRCQRPRACHPSGQYAFRFPPLDTQERTDRCPGPHDTHGGALRPPFLGRGTGGEGRRRGDEVPLRHQRPTPRSTRPVDRVCFEHLYDTAGNNLWTEHLDSGAKTLVVDAQGKPDVQHGCERRSGVHGLRYPEPPNGHLGAGPGR